MSLRGFLPSGVFRFRGLGGRERKRVLQRAHPGLALEGLNEFTVTYGRFGFRMV